MENLVKALEERTEEKHLKLSERILKAKYISKKRGPGGRWAYKYAPTGGKKRPKESLYSKQVKQKKAAAVGEKLPIGKEYKPIVAELHKDSVKNLKTAMGHGFKLPSMKELAESAFQGMSDMYDDDYKAAREAYVDAMQESYHEQSREELLEDYLEPEDEEEAEAITKMSKEDLIEALSEHDYEMASDLSGDDIAEKVYGSPEKMAKDSPGELAMVLEGDIYNYLDENDLQ